MANRVIAAALVAIGLAGILLELFCSSVRGWFGSHQFTTALVAESLLLVAVFLFVNRFIERRERMQWNLVALPLIVDLWELADGLKSALALLALEGSAREDKDRHYRMVEMLAGTYRDVLSGLYPILTASPDLAHLIPLAKRVGERARYAAAELNVDFETDAKLYESFLESYREFEQERRRHFPS